MLTAKFWGQEVLGGPSTSASWTLSAAPSTWAMMAVPLTQSSTTAVKVDSLTATQYEGGSLIEVEDRTCEISSLGFNLYREQNGQRIQLNSSLLPGSALLAGPKKQPSLRATRMPGWTSLRRAVGLRIGWKKLILNGAHTIFGPVFPEPAAEAKSPALSPLIAEGERSELKPQMLSELGKACTHAGRCWARSCGPANSGSLPFQRAGADRPLRQKRDSGNTRSRPVRRSKSRFVPKAGTALRSRSSWRQALTPMLTPGCCSYMSMEENTTDCCVSAGGRKIRSARHSGVLRLSPEHDLVGHSGVLVGGGIDPR